MLKIFLSHFLATLENNGGLLALVTLIISCILALIGFLSKEKLKSIKAWVIILTIVMILLISPVVVTTIQMQSNAEMFYEIALMQLDKDQYANAKDNFTKVIELDGNNYASYYYRAQCYSALFVNSDGSEDDNELLLAVISDYTTIIDELRPQMMHITMKNEDIERYTQLINNSIEMTDHERADLYLTLHDLQSQMPQIKLSPKAIGDEFLPSIYCATLYNRGELLRMLYLYEESIDDFSELISVYPTALSYFLRGMSEFELGRHDDALDDMSYAIDLNPTIAPFYMNRALVNCELHDYNNAFEDIDKAIMLDPSNDYYTFIYGYICFHSKDYNAALQALDSVIEQNQGNYLYYSLRGEVYMYIGDFANVIKDYDIAIQLNNSVGYFYYVRGTAKIMLSDVEGCRTDFQQAHLLGYSLDEDLKEAFDIK